REAAVVRELERLALRIGQLRQRRLHALPLEPQPRVVLGGRRRRLGRALERLGPPPVLAPDDVHGAPVDEREQPRPRRPALPHSLAEGRPSVRTNRPHAAGEWAGTTAIRPHLHGRRKGAPKTMRKLALCLSALAALTAGLVAVAVRGGPGAATASSHREAPLI